MSMIFRLRMLSLEDENFVRDYELPYTMNLFDFHNFICDDLGYDSQNMSSFFSSNDEWEKIQEFTLLDMGIDDMENPPQPMDKIILGQILHQNFDRLIYCFNIFENRSMYLELSGAEKEKDGFEYPRVMFANGDAPSQFDTGASVPSESIFDQVMDDFGDFEGDDLYDDDFL